MSEGKVDFADKRVKINKAKMDLGVANRKDILEVDLGDVQSLKSNEVRVEDMLKS